MRILFHVSHGESQFPLSLIRGDLDVVAPNNKGVMKAKLKANNLCDYPHRYHQLNIIDKPYIITII